MKTSKIRHRRLEQHRLTVFVIRGLTLQEPDVASVIQRFLVLQEHMGKQIFSTLSSIISTIQPATCTISELFGTHSLHSLFETTPSTRSCYTLHGFWLVYMRWRHKNIKVMTGPIFSKETRVLLYIKAWCLANNVIHLLIQKTDLLNDYTVFTDVERNKYFHPSAVSGAEKKIQPIPD